MHISVYDEAYEYCVKQSLHVSVYAVPGASNYMRPSPEISNGLYLHCKHSEVAFTPAVSALHGDAIMGLSSGEHTASAGWKAKYENIRQIRGLTTTLLPDYV